MEKMDMREEKKPSTKMLLPEGWRRFTIAGCEERLSKSQNKMYVITAQDVKTEYDDTWYAVAEPKKRWFLKLIMDACGVPCEDGVYTFEPPLSNSLIGKSVEGLVVHEDNEYINREGETVNTKQHKVVDIRPSTNEQSKQDEEVAWDEEL